MGPWAMMMRNLGSRDKVKSMFYIIVMNYEVLEDKANKVFLKIKLTWQEFLNFF